MLVCIVEAIYARLWEEDRLTKCKREETEAAMQVERNREALKVSQIAALLLQ